MSSFADSRAAIAGAGGSGAVTAYRLGGDQRLRLEAVTFVYATSSAAATRHPVVALFDQAGALITRIEDLNDVSASSTIGYTFGIGLAAFCGIVGTAGYVRAELPDTVLEAGSSVTLTSINATTAATITGDAFSSVVLYGTSESGAGPIGDVVPLLTPIALADQLGAVAGAALGGGA